MTLKEQIARDEGGFRSKPYRDSRGFLTIGYGRCLDTEGITMAEGEYLLDNDIRSKSAELLTVLSWVADLDEVRRGVLENMAYNLGVQGLLGFHKMLAAMQKGDWATAAIEALNSEWAQQVGSRAYRLSRQIETGVWT
jgi:lysozyme